ncbi:lamin tail domain-containing protein [Spirosoma fluminis]
MNCADAWAQAPGKVVISQVYGGGGATTGTPTYTNDYVELFNQGGTAVSIAGWSLQYGSSTGNIGANSSAIVSLTGTIEPGHYYLVQLGSAGTVGSVLPIQPDLTTPNLNLSASAGKVALVNNATGLGCGATATLCDQANLGKIVDLVGYGSANFFEGSGTVPTLSNATAAIRNLNGCTDTNNNNADFTTGTPNPRNSASPVNLCGGPASPSLVVTPSSRTGINGLAYVEGSGPASTTISVTGSSLNAATGTITASSSSTAFIISPTTATFSGSALSASTFTVQLEAGLTAANGPYSGTITFEGGGATAVVPVSGTVTAPPVGGITPIGTARTLVNQTVTIQGTVTASGQLGTKQLYVQDNTGGVLVYSGSGTDYTAQTQIGDVVKLQGRIELYQGGIEVNGVQAFTLVSTGNPAPMPTPITLDQIGNYQGQLVSITGASVSPASTTFSSGNVTVSTSVNSATATLRISANSGLVGAGQPTAPFSITGIADRFLANAPTTGTDNIQLLPRQLSDVQGATPPAAPTDQYCGSSPVSGNLTQDQTFDFATFNTEFFGAPAGTIVCANRTLSYQNQGPTNETLQAQNVNKVLSAINADVFVLEEVSDENLLRNNLPAGYALSCSDRFSYYFQDDCMQTPDNQGFVFGPTSLAQKVCVAYKTSTVTSVSASALLSDYYGFPTTTPAASAPNNWSSGRLPYLFVADATINGVTRRLNIIGIHAKSGSATADYNRRKQDILDLYNLLTNSSTQPGLLGGQFTKANIIIAGDFNDNLTGSIATGQNSTYKPFVDDKTNFAGLTLPLEDEQSCNTFFGNAGSSFLDQIIISNELFDAYVPGSVGIQTSFSAISGNFTNTTSDHRPVFARFDLSKIPAPLTTTLVASTSAVCAGSPVNFSVSVSGLSTGDTYSYTISNGTNSTSASGVSASPAQTSLVPTVTGSYTVTVVTSASTSATATSGNVALNALPTNASLTSGTLTCTATSVTLTASATGGTAYTLSNGQTSQTNETGQFVVSTAGTYTATISNANGCLAAATSTVASSTLTPTVSLSNTGPLSFTNASVTLTASGGSSYTFSTGADQQGGVSGATATVTTAGIYSVTAQDANGCTATASTTVTGGNSPTVCRSASATINVVVVGKPLKYEWYKNSLTSPKLMETPQLFRGTATSSLTLINAQSNTQGNFYLKTTDQSGTVTVYGPFRLTVDASCRARELAVEKATAEPGLTLTILGNPLVDGQLKATISGAAGKAVHVQLMDTRGHAIYQQQAIDQQRIDWNLSTHPSGLYTLQAYTDQQQVIYKIVKP